MKTLTSILAASLLFQASPSAALTNLFYGGNGTVQVDSGLPGIGVMYGVARNGDLLWYRYTGKGDPDRSGATGWDPASSNPIGNGWQNFTEILGGGDGVMLAIDRAGNMRWYRYLGDGEPDRSAATGWHPNSGNVIGNGWQNFRQVVATPRQGRWQSSRLTIYAVDRAGDLRWYRYDGGGESDPSGHAGWHPNSGNVIGNGWQGFSKLVAIDRTILGIKPNGDLLWYRYDGKGEADPSGSTGWAPNSGNPIGNGWQNFREVFGGASVVYAVAPNGDLLWYRYDGKGESDVSGATGWAPKSSSVIGNGW